MATPAKQPGRHDLLEIWRQHTYAEFVLQDADVAVATMTDDAYVLLVPIMKSAVGKAAVRDTYANHFINQTPADLVNTSIAVLVGEDLLIEEMILSFTHDIQMDWVLPGVPPTGRRVELAAVAIIGFREGKIAFERLYWDQATVLLQVGLVGASTPAVAGAESARRVLELAAPAGPPVQPSGPPPELLGSG
jgi:carboxymethylenebutenolidase